MGDFVIKNMPMICASAEAEQRKYRKINGKHGSIWLVAVQDNPASNIYYWSPGKSDGFAGRTLRFELEDGSHLDLQGPWHSNAEDLFTTTGVDVRDKYLTFGIIAKSSEHKTIKNPGYLNSYVTVFKDVLYQDKDWTVGYFDRIEDMAQNMANELGKKVVFYSQSQCGSTQSSKYPNNKENKNG